MGVRARFGSISCAQDAFCCKILEHKTDNVPNTLKIKPIAL